MSIIKSVAALALLGWTSMASAHFLWLEPAGKSKVRAYFGEWADNLREKTDGFLGMFTIETSWPGQYMLEAAHTLEKVG